MGSTPMGGLHASIHSACGAAAPPLHEGSPCVCLRPGGEQKGCKFVREQINYIKIIKYCYYVVYKFDIAVLLLLIEFNNDVDAVFKTVNEVVYVSI